MGGINTYAYVEGNPLNGIDPLGLVGQPGFAGPTFFTLTTFEAAKTGTTLDQAVQNGALTRAVTLPTLGVAMSPNAAALVGSTGLMCGASASTELISVSRWGRPGLQSGDWVMKGNANWWNYLRSFKWQPGVGNRFTPYSAGEIFQVPANVVRWPSGWGIDGAWKGLFGQRVIGE